MSRAPFNAATRRIVDGIVEAFDRFDPPLTVRQVYYQLASVGLVPLSPKGYRIAQRLCLRVRELGIVDWDSFADRTREVDQRSQWGGLDAFARAVALSYRRDYWASQREHVEVWLEKDALAGFIGEITRPLGVPLYVARGFSSATFIREAAVSLVRIDKPKHIYYLGDHDPSGLSIEGAIRDRLRDFGADFHFSRLAITLVDIERYGLRPLEAKRTDSRYARYVAAHGEHTIELDALPPDELRARVADSIKAHIDQGQWERIERVEEIEQETIRMLAARIGGGL
jgi:hypothetical protein